MNFIYFAWWRRISIKIAPNKSCVCTQNSKVPCGEKCAIIVYNSCTRRCRTSVSLRKQCFRCILAGVLFTCSPVQLGLLFRVKTTQPLGDSPDCGAAASLTALLPMRAPHVQSDVPTQNAMHESGKATATPSNTDHPVRLLHNALCGGAYAGCGVSQVASTQPS